MAFQFGECELDRDRFELTHRGQPVSLEPRAMQVLLHLIDARGRMVPKAELLDSIWGDRFVSESALSSQIKAIRRAIGDTGDAQRMVRTVHGQGYRFVAPVTEGAPHEAPPTPETGNELLPLWQPVVAVLPFTDLDPSSGRPQLGRGLRYDLIAALSKYRWLRVLTSAATAGLAGQADVIDRLRSELDVRYAVEGTLWLGGDHLRVSVNLTDTSTGVCLWADRFERRVERLFDVLDEIVSTVVATVEPEVGYAERTRSGALPRTDMQVWDTFHLGLHRFFQFTAEGNEDAQRMLSECRSRDPGFPDAHAWWAYATVLGMVYWGTDPVPDLLDEALAASRQALRKDEQNALFHVLYGRVQLARREYGPALTANERALELNPTFAAAYCGVGDSLCYEGRYREAMAHFRRSVALGSHDPQLWAFYTYGALALVFDKQFDEAIEWTRKASSIVNCQYWTTAHRAVALAHLGRVEEAECTARDLLAQCPQFSQAYADRKLFYLKRPEQRELYLEGLRSAQVPAGDPD
nr:winged helix-turn-helix domain-containing protein [Ruania alba]